MPYTTATALPSTKAPASAIAAASEPGTALTNSVAIFAVGLLNVSTTIIFAPLSFALAMRLATSGCDSTILPIATMQSAFASPAIVPADASIPVDAGVVKFLVFKTSSANFLTVKRSSFVALADATTHTSSPLYEPSFATAAIASSHDASTSSLPFLTIGFVSLAGLFTSSYAKCPFWQVLPSQTGERWKGAVPTTLPSFMTRLNEQPVPQNGHTVGTYLNSIITPLTQRCFNVQLNKGGVCLTET